MSFTDIKITYPNVAKHKVQRDKFINIARWPVLVAAIVCPVINILIGGKAWSVIVLMGLYMAWTLLLSPDLVEYNRISQFTKLIISSCVMLCLIDYFLSSGWAIEVVPIVSFSGLIISGILLFTDMERQKQNMLPLISLIFLSIVGSVIGLSVWHEKGSWALAVMGALAIILLITCIVVLGNDFLRELKRRFHIK